MSIILDMIELLFIFILGANRITRATFSCFLITIVAAFGEIFLEYSWKILKKSLNFF
jgi:hypothetical protein